MTRASVRGVASLANLLVVAGFAAIAVLTWLPHMRARRMAQAELAAVRTLHLLLKASAVAADGAFTAADTGAVIARVVAEHGGETLVVVPQSGSAANAWQFAGPQYCFVVLLAPQPPSPAVAALKPSLRARRPPVEAYAFPRSSFSYGRSAFCIAEDLPMAYSRNLLAGYSGVPGGPLPSPGAGRSRDPDEDLLEGDYRGNDNERWILVPPWQEKGLP